MISWPSVLGTVCVSLCLACFAAPTTFFAQSDGDARSTPSLSRKAPEGNLDSATEAAREQPPAEGKPPGGSDSSLQPPLDRTESRDPTQPGPALRDLLAPPETAPRRASQPTLPEISLKGRVIPAGKPGAAILEIDGQILSIAAGNETTISAPAGLMTLHLRRLSAAEVRLHVLPLDQELVLH